METEFSKLTSFTFDSLNSRKTATDTKEVARSAATAGPTHASMVSPLADSLMIGGLSMITFVLYWLYVDREASAYTVAEFAFWLSFVVNFPHFFSSYQLLYGDHRKQIFKKKSFLWAAVGAPVLIVGALAYGILAQDPRFLGLLAQAMFLSVGWHYVRQIFGTAVVASAVQKRYFTSWERSFILLNLYSLWAMSWVAANISLNQTQSDGIKYFTLGLPDWLMTATYVSTGVSLAIVFGLALVKYIKTGVRPATASIVGFATIYVWYIPTLNHPLYFFLVPFFHSLQYMLFVSVLKWNQAREVAALQPDGPTQRLVFLRKYWGFLILAGILGALAFEAIPRGLDQYFALDAAIFGPTLWLFAFNIFINLHHYFIDNVIWRGDNEDLRKYIVQASQRRHDSKQAMNNAEAAL